ncbi:acyl-CoA dehydrogenase family protein [Microbacterium invictum]|uniref:Alkylation response protein AidB-like acyl-CoA dehydrogenase n=1 Tax=Microbacterium invictum TaxID=515415 RepID=A0AA40VPI9_9MICO|nr:MULTISPECIES: acyl-CoA dehydrogenase family protein [Microbacterium]MBB4141363.1 alkylation response protein AidB-like acyl-CoA dehydrogenase [Microbacterium invictum]
MDTLEETLTLQERASLIGPVLAEHAARHDADGTFVEEGLAAMRDAGLLKAAVPVELGGDGATVAELAALQRELAHHCGSTALATAMHQHVVRFTTWRYRRGLPGAEATLRRVADDGVLLVSTGGDDFTRPNGTAVPVEGGYRVSGTKRFASLSPAGTVMSTMFTVDDLERGRRVINVAVPFAAPGVHVADNWNTLGMRGTASNNIDLTDVFVPAQAVLADRPWGVIDAPLQVIASIGFSVIAAVYLGVAESAYAAAVAGVAGTADDPLVQRQVGEMSQRLRVASWALDGALRLVGDDPQPSIETFAAVMAAKAEIARTGVAVTDAAMALAGGRAYFKGSIIERAYRDVRAAAFHPLTPEETLMHAGRLALGLDADRR